MPENNFEKEVSKLMEGFTLQPSEAAWQKIEPQVTDRDTRKRGLFFLLAIAALLLGVGVYYAGYNSSNRHLKGKSKTEIFSVQQPPVALKDTGKTIAPAIKQNKLDDIANSVPNYSTPQRLNTKQGKKKGEFSDTPATANSLVDDNNKTRRKQQRKLYAGNIHSTVAAATITDENVGQENIAETTINEKTIVAEAPAADSVLTAAMLHDTAVSTTTHTAVKKNEAGKSKNKKWTLWAQVSGGISATGSSYLSSVPSSAYYYQSLADASTGGSAPPNFSVHSASLMHRGASIFAGISASRAFNRRWSMVAGLQYRYLSTSMPVTLQNDSVMTGNAKRYKNKFHFISLPLSIQYIAGVNNKLPVYLHTGFALSMLAGTNALQFDNRNGYYYADNGMFKKMQAGIHAGASINLRHSKHRPLLVGPLIEYSLSPIADKGLYGNTHYSFIGLQLKQQLGKK
jgi:hypothetical protein